MQVSEHLWSIIEKVTQYDQIENQLHTSARAKQTFLLLKKGITVLIIFSIPKTTMFADSQCIEEKF